MVKEYLINAKNQLEERRKNEVATLSRKIQTEKIEPFNTEIDKAFQRAVAEKREQMNVQIVAIQKDFDEQVKQMQEASAEKKQAYAQSVIATETANLNAIFDKVISGLEKQIAEIEV